MFPPISLSLSFVFKLIGKKKSSIGIIVYLCFNLEVIVDFKIRGDKNLWRKFASILGQKNLLSFVLCLLTFYYLCANILENYLFK